VVESLEAMLALPLDGIVIATPSALHAQQTLHALERGRAVFCQKPLGRDVCEVRQVVEQARRSDRLLGVDLSYRYTLGIQRLRALLQAGELGQVYAVNLVFHNAYGPDKPWFYDPRLSGGGALMDLGTHLVDLALWVLDFPKVNSVSSRLFAQGQPLRDRMSQVDDYAVGQVTLDSGAVLSLSCSWRLHAGCDCAIEASFYGTHAGVSFRNVNGSFYDFQTEVFSGTSRRSIAAPPDDWGPRAAVDWAQRLSRGARFDADAEHCVQVSELLDQLYAGVQAPAAVTEPACAY
jgi:predicted dehydrogenase